ncbi:MFS transporter [Neobacillus sp. OS1-32]|jgi:DHA3 family macrolide efflux protein-like MFS transporter|uniref:MFS transporter n=1 Tax=Neobacillus sp. OS1-32 TaxID=3070682 RepID=UPI0027DEE3BF|nr:MFS transporter [Neobacillus sp. OS1-32]WML28808.1 MFS transporter [Neobacillus sp. OS1-32]
MDKADSNVSIGALFKNRVIQTLLLSTLFLQIGVWVRNYSILLFVVEQTNENPVAVSFISVAEFAPIFLFSFIGGTFADRWKPKRTMIWCDFLSAVSIFVVLLTLVFGSWKAIFFATFVSSILSQFSQPSGMKLFKLHVKEELIQMGMSIYQTIFALFMILGPVLGTFVYQQFGIDVAIAVMGVAFLFSAAILFLLPADFEMEKKAETTSLVQEMKDGFQYVLKSRVLTLLGGCFATAGLALGLTQPLGVFLVTEQLGLPKEQLQWLMAAFGVGMILGGGLTIGISKKVSPQILLAIGMLACAIGFFVMGISKLFWLTLAAEFFSGVFNPAIQIGINTMILKNTEAEFIGRVNGILNPIFMGTMVVMMTASGWLKKTFSLVAMYETTALLFIIGILFLVPLFRSSAAVLSKSERA